MSSTPGKRTLALVLLAACGGGHAAAPGPRVAAVAGPDDGGSRITLYRDRAVVRQRVDGVAVAGVATVVPVKLARDVEPGKVFVLDAAEVGVASVQALKEPGNYAVTVMPRAAGAFSLHLSYETDELPWLAQYSMTTSAAHDRSVLHGAISITNQMGVALPGVRVRLVDTEMSHAAVRTAELLRQAFTGAATSTSPIAAPRDLGVVDLAAGETRIELLPESAPRKMRSVLVYDPIGNALDHPGKDVDSEEQLGVLAKQRPRVSESLELQRDTLVSAGLPGGPVRLFERQGDGTLMVLGQSRIFDTATRAAETDIVEVGTAEGVTGRRDRKDYNYDEDRRRLTEEIRVTLKNDRPVPVEVVVREHLYRSENWTIAFASHGAVKEGQQQIAVRAIVPAKGKASVTYVVVYMWDAPAP